MTSKETAVPLKDAVARLDAAHAALDAARAEVEHAENTLDARLAEVGWERFRGGFSGKLYVKPGSNPVTFGEVIAHELGVVA
jgi:hypothetical protein